MTRVESDSSDSEASEPDSDGSSPQQPTPAPPKSQPVVTTTPQPTDRKLSKQSTTSASDATRIAAKRDSSQSSQSRPPSVSGPAPSQPQKPIQNDTVRAAAKQSPSARPNIAPAAQKAPSAQAKGHSIPLAGKIQPPPPKQVAKPLPQTFESKSNSGAKRSADKPQARAEPVAKKQKSTAPHASIRSEAGSSNAAAREILAKHALSIAKLKGLAQQQKLKAAQRK